ncbi:ABC transporter substrate-binding protein [Acidithiobacillus ferrooxidans]|uniref:ABC transporter substrate-binding protein n=1 Tax=Acidithiobacillus ferrooxidans TaxID=920 RepID=UPI0013D86B65|nr:ABC transporter substrate-binding protein [Acidithiobacillus ferrooxidans]
MFMSDRKVKIVLLNMAIGLLSTSASVAWATGTTTKLVASPASVPQEVVTHLNDALIQSMKNGGSGSYQQRYQILYPVVTKVFNFPVMARLTLGTSWSKLTASQQHQFIKILTKYSVANYAAHFDHYEGQEFSSPSSKKLEKGRVMVVSNLIPLGGGKKNEFAYLLEKSNGHWKILNVSTDGVSSLAMEKSEFTEAMKHANINTLIEKLMQSTAELAKGSQ